MSDDATREGNVVAEGRVLSVHFGRSANCSSVGSVVDVLFLSSTAGAAILAGLALHLASRETDTEALPAPRPAAGRLRTTSSRSRLGPPLVAPSRRDTDTDTDTDTET